MGVQIHEHSVATEDDGDEDGQQDSDGRRALRVDDEKVCVVWRRVCGVSVR